MRSAVRFARFISPVVLLTVLLLGFTASLASIATGCAGNQRQKTLRATLTTLSAARDGFEKWDELRQQQIVEKAQTREEGRAALDAFRAKRDPIYGAFEIAFRVVATASLQGDDQSLKKAIEQAQKVLGLIAELQGGS